MESNISSSNKRLAKNTMYLYLRSILTLLITLYTSRVILDQLGVLDFGIYSVVSSISTFLTIVSGTLSHAMCRYLSYEMKEGNEEKLRTVFSSCLNITFIAIIICLVALETIGVWFLNNKLVIPAERMHAANIAFQCTIFIFLVRLFLVPYNALLIARENMSVFAKITILDVVLKLGVAYMLVFAFCDKLVLYSGLLLIQAIILILCYVLYCLKKYSESHYIRSFDKQTMGQLSSFSGWTFIGSITFVLRESGVDFLLNIFCGPIVNAAKTVSTQVTGNVSVFGTQFLQATVPQITKFYADEKLEEMRLLVSRSCRYGFYLLFIIAFPVFCFTQNILEIWLVEVPEYSASFIRILLFYCLISIMSQPLENGIRSVGKIRNYQLWYAFIEFLNIPIVYLVLKMGSSPLMAAVVVVCVGFVGMLCRLYYAKINFGFAITTFIKEVFMPIFIVVALAGVVWGVLSLIQPVGIIDLLLHLVVVTITEIAIIYFFGLNKKERVFAKERALVFVKEKLNFGRRK